MDFAGKNSNQLRILPVKVAAKSLQFSTSSNRSMKSQKELKSESWWEVEILPSPLKLSRHKKLDISREKLSPDVGKLKARSKIVILVIS